MRVASSPAGTPSSDERTPLVVRHESDSARLRLIGSWSRKAKLAVVGACCFSLVVYASQNSSSSGAYLSEGNLIAADLGGANLNGSNVIQAIMKGAILCKTTMPDGSVIYSGC